MNSQTSLDWSSCTSEFVRPLEHAGLLRRADHPADPARVTEYVCIQDAFEDGSFGGHNGHHPYIMASVTRSSAF